MRKLQPLDADDVAIHQQLLGNLKPPVTSPQILSALEARFKQYASVAPAVHSLPPVATILGPHLNAIHNFYDSEANHVQQFLASVRKIEVSRCPYCGGPSPFTIDHILPRSKFKEFSLYSKNLVPCCGFCNLKKWNHVVDENGGRLFLNPYYDAYLEDIFVSISVLPDDDHSYDMPLFEFTFFHDRLSQSDRDTCNTHFSTLGIFDLLREYCGVEFRVLRRRLSSRMTRERLDINVIRMELAEEDEARRAEWGQNCWESLFLRSIFTDDAVLAHVATVPYVPNSPIP